MPINYPLLDQVLAYIKENPETWQQEYWNSYCGTKFCFAGHTALMVGAKLPKGQSWYIDNLTGESVPIESLSELSVHVSEYAQEKLGLSVAQAEILFKGNNSLDDLITIVANLHKDPEAYNWLEVD